MPRPSVLGTLFQRTSRPRRRGTPTVCTSWREGGESMGKDGPVDITDLIFRPHGLSLDCRTCGRDSFPGPVPTPAPPPPPHAGSYGYNKGGGVGGGVGGKRVPATGSWQAEACSAQVQTKAQSISHQIPRAPLRKGITKPCKDYFRRKLVHSISLQDNVPIYLSSTETEKTNAHTQTSSLSSCSLCKSCVDTFQPNLKCLCVNAVLGNTMERSGAFAVTTQLLNSRGVSHSDGGFGRDLHSDRLQFKGYIVGSLNSAASRVRS